MGMVARPTIEVLFLCEECGLPIRRLEKGLLLDWNGQPELAAFKKRGVILHAPEGGNCHKNWLLAHKGNWAIYGLADIIARLGVSYGTEWLRYAVMAVERAGKK